MGDALFTLRGRAAWAHNFDTAPDAALVTAGAEIAWRNGFALSASFEGEFSNNVTSYTGKGTLRYAW